MTETQLNLYEQIYAHSKALWAEKQMKNELVKQGKEKESKNVWMALVDASLCILC